MIRLLPVLLLLSGCMAPATIPMVSAIAGAVAASARLDLVIVCAVMGSEGIQEARDVSAVCQQPAGAVSGL